MQYPELDKFDSTPDQDLALTIAFKKADRTPAQTPGEYLRLAVLEKLDAWVGEHVSGVQQSRVSEALARATDQEKQAVAAALKIDLTIESPSGKP